MRWARLLRCVGRRWGDRQTDGQTVGGVGFAVSGSAVPAVGLSIVRGSGSHPAVSERCIPSRPVQHDPNPLTARAVTVTVTFKCSVVATLVGSSAVLRKYSVS